MLTLYYCGATFLQHWRIKNVCTKITDQLSQQASIAFYALPAATQDGYDATLATSELCINRNAAKVTEILWLHGNQRGCCLRPKQSLQIMPWVSFPEAPSWLPFAHVESPEKLVERLASARKDLLLHLLLETEIQPCYKQGRNEDVVRIEDYGKLIAWKIDSHLAVLIETDVEHFTKLLISTFLQNNFLINDQLPLIRIESVDHEGNPQPFEMVSSHLRKSTRTSAHLCNDDWQKHLENLRSLSVLANQATEFEYNKNRTEGKTGVVKPDLIPHEKKAPVAGDKAVAGEKLPDSKVITLTTTPSKGALIKSPAKKEPSIAEESMKLITSEKTELESQTKSSPTSKLGKMRAKPTEIRKPGTTVTDGRFKTTKVSESPEKTTSQPTTTTATPGTSVQIKDSPAKTATQSSELEKIAAAAVAQKQKSPLHTVSVTPTPPSIASIEVEKPTQATTSNASSSVAANAHANGNNAPPPVSVSRDNTKRPSLRRNKDSLRESKPLNILIYSDSASARESAVATLKDILEKDMYTIYPMTPQQVEQKFWLENTALLVVCGAVASNTGQILVDYFLRGGKVLSLCSDILHFILPTYRTAEVREHELVQFSYDKWQKVQMMHHIFCYQPSPVKKNFSTDSDDSGQAMSRKPALVCPRSIELKDLHGELHNLDVKVLGSEETWNTPSILLANSVKSGGKAVFSQIHLETNPSQFEADESKFSILKKNEKIRLEILADLLGKHLYVNVKQANAVGHPTKQCIYQNAYFLGRHESKFEFLEKLKENSGTDNITSNSKLTLKFCGKDDKPPNANTSILPILIHSCPEDFSTVEYFDNLKTDYIGRLVIYAPLVSSSMNVIHELELIHGLAVLPRQQTDGVGRSNNQWLSPLGCAMFSIQLHISLDSKLGSRLPLIQHIVGTAIVNSLKSHEIYKNLDIALKWPNDIYANGLNKIGGLIVKTTLMGSTAIVNIGSGINLDNAKPTLCINDMINEYNRGNRQHLPLLKYERFVAMVFNEIERLVEIVQTGDFEQFYKLYYDLWLHNNQTVTICDKDNEKKDAQVLGIDDYGYLKVKMSSGAVESVQPDGNSFDMLKGLIVPKFN